MFCCLASGLFGCRSATPLTNGRLGPATDVVAPASVLTDFAKTGAVQTPSAQIDLRIFTLNEAHEAIQGATVVFEGQQTQLNYGRLSNGDGSCHFSLPAGAYTLRIQFTGLKTFLQRNFVFSEGTGYRLEVGMAGPATPAETATDRASRPTAARDGM
jgi:hypothetical protein